jgi:toxin FitB
MVRLYGERVLPIDATVAGAWGSLRAIRTVPVIDAFLAATAQVHDLMVVTQNDQDFKGLGVRVLNPVKESLSAGSTA